MELPSPPDERIDAPPPGLEWLEHIRPNGGAVTFRGRRPPTYFGVWLVIVLAGAIFLASGASAGRRAGKELSAAIAMTVLAGFLAWRWRTSAVSAGDVDVDGSRVRVEPVGMLARARDFPLASVDYFAAETEIEMREASTWDGRRRRVESYRWYPVYARLTTGERVAVAAFAEREQALFLAQRLQMLTERAKSVAGIRYEPRPIVPRPYR
jgi:hypothetical protein